MFCQMQLRKLTFLFPFLMDSSCPEDIEGVWEPPPLGSKALILISWEEGSWGKVFTVPQLQRGSLLEEQLLPIFCDLSSSSSLPNVRADTLSPVCPAVCRWNLTRPTMTADHDLAVSSSFSTDMTL